MCFSSQQKVWPLSLLALRASCSAYTLPRKPVTSAEPFTEYIKQQGFTQETPEAVDNETASSRDGQTDLTIALHPLQQITVNWGIANNELSAGEYDFCMGFTHTFMCVLLSLNFK